MHSPFGLAEEGEGSHRALPNPGGERGAFDHRDELPNLPMGVRFVMVMLGMEVRLPEVIVGLMRFVRSLGRSAGETDGHLDCVDRTALYLLDPHRHVREAQPAG
jgi:hypothetical protein